MTFSICFSEVLCELYYIQINVESVTTEQANKNIRSNLRLLNNDAFLKENGVLALEVIELYSDIQLEDEDRSPWKVYCYLISVENMNILNLGCL